MNDKMEEVSEIEGKWGDKSLRAKSKYMAELIAFLCCILLVALTVALYQHVMDAKDRDQNLLTALDKRDREFVMVIKELTVVQRDMVAVQREQNCLFALPAEMRDQRAAICKQIAR